LKTKLSRKIVRCLSDDYCRRYPSACYTRFNILQDFSPADTADPKVCTTFFLCGAPSVKRARNIPGGATNDKYAKSKQLFVIGVGFIWQKWIKSILLTVSSRSKSIHGDYSIKTELLLE
jgi:hypothetical protein